MKRKDGLCSTMKKYINEGSDLIRECVGKTILTLMKSMNFDEITVNDICKAAYIGRTTFYRYFGTKDGKRKAVYFRLSNGWKNTGKSDLPIPTKDKEFITYLYSIKDELILLYINNFTDIIDTFIFEVYGSVKDEQLSYFKYAGAGIWVGIIRALLENKFTDDIETVNKNIQDGILQLIKLNK